ncbi:MAG: DinB family protein [Thermomicrobiales bacterium]
MDDRVVIEAFTDKIVEYIERILATCDGLDEAGINWKPEGTETNSIYVLATHVIGNVRQNALAVLGGQEDQRDRDAEFVATGNSAIELQEQWADLKPRVIDALGKIGSAELTHEYPHPRRGTITGLGVLMLAATHAGEHAGQAELTRSLYSA